MIIKTARLKHEGRVATAAGAVGIARKELYLMPRRPQP